MRKINNSKTTVIGFYGYSNSGKTSVIFKLIAKLKTDGYASAVIKRTDKAISSEPKDKDTGAYRAAGTNITSFSSLNETNFVIPQEMTTNEIIEKIQLLSTIDVVIVEGVNEPDIKKVRLGEIPIRENTIYQYNGDFDHLYTLIVDMI